MAYATIDKPSQYFGINAYAGQGGSRNVTDATNVQFTPDFVWVKHRQDTPANHALFDVIRGVGKFLESSTTTAEQTESQSITAFINGGFSVGTQPNTPRTDESGGTPNHVAWQWKANGTGVSNTSGTITSTVSANTTSGFSIVKFTGNGTGGATIGHGLGTKPNVIILKSYENGQQWASYWSALGATKNMRFNSNGAVSTTSTRWNNTEPTSTLFTVGNDGEVNTSGDDHIAYCFADVKGFSKFSSFIGNGSTDGTFVYTGFTPAFVILKNATTGLTSWEMADNKRALFNVNDKTLKAETSGAEQTYNFIDFLSNGFKLRYSSDSNTSGNTIIYMAFASSPFVSSKGIPTTAR